MRISAVRTTPLLVPYKKPYHWAQGTTHGACVILVEVSTDEGVTGYGECVGTPSPAAIEAYLGLAADLCIGRDPFENLRLMAEVHHALFKAQGTGSALRFAGHAMAGLEMALWDVMGKAAGHAVHELLGGAVRDEIGYFGFPQGQTAEELAADARSLADSGCDIIYVKVGRGDELDLAIVEQVRAAIGPHRRLRLDPNEHWAGLTAARMMPKIARFDVEFVEQPTDCESIDALAKVRADSPVAVAADQLVFTPYDVYDVCRSRAADLIVLGLHETGGIASFRKAAHIAEAAGIDICIHGLHETGITTCAANQAAAGIPNLDDGNQYMNHFLEWDIIRQPDLTLQNGALPVLAGPGLGFELDENAVDQAKEAYLRSNA